MQQALVVAYEFKLSLTQVREMPLDDWEAMLGYLSGLSKARDTETADNG